MSEDFRMSMFTAALKITEGSAQHQCTPKEFVRFKTSGDPLAGVDYPTALAFMERNPAIAEALETCSASYRLRLIVELTILREPPPWRLAAPYGRDKMLRSMPGDHKQVLLSAGLLADAPDVAEFWDRVSAEERRLRELDLLATGREGERLSMEVETAHLARAGRLDLRPTWVALNDNSAGYDVSSWRISPPDVHRVFIEVKASKLRHAIVHLTRGEWEFACKHPANWLLHVWHIGSSPPKMVAWTFEDVVPHIPGDVGDGKWEKVAITIEVPAA